jgi:NAD(P)-dependent dehydrogenase (short-subunit alcohol dehydrogenase family)
VKLKDRVVVITGAGSIAPGWGIGKACSVAYARQGALVIAVDISGEAARQTAALISAEGGVCTPYEMDVSDADGVTAMIAEVHIKQGKIDVVHHNVGIGQVGGPTDITLQDWQRIQSVNMDSLFNITRAVLPAMEERRAGVLLATSSVAGQRYVGYPHLAYSVTKAATIHYMKMIALQYAHVGIRANSIIAGLIDTPRIAHTVAKQFSNNSLEEARAARDRQVPLGKMGTAWDVANAAVFLVSDDAAYITGTELVVDGGITAKYS